MICEFRSLKRPWKLLTLILGTALFLQVCYLGWACLTQWASHLDGDSSTQILKVMEIVKARSLSLTNWHDTTSLLLDMPILPAALLTPLCGGRVFLAYGLSVFLLDIACSFIMDRLFAAASVPIWARWTALLLFLCPYGEAEWLSYANCTLTQSGYYSMRLLYYLLLLYGMVLFFKNANRAALIVSVFVTGFSLLIGLSSGMFMALMVTLPLLLFCAVRAACDRQVRFLSSPVTLLPLVSLLGILAGTWVQHNIIHFSSREAGIQWIGFRNFLSNFSSVFQGYWKLLSGMPQDATVSILSTQGLLYACGYAVALVLPLGLFWTVHTALHSQPTPLSSLAILRGGCAAVALFDLFICLSASLHYGETIYEVRYLLFAAISLMILFASWLPAIPLPGALGEVCVSVLTILLLGNLCRNDAVYAKPTYDFSMAQAATQAMDEAFPDAKVVYMISNDHDRKVLRVADQSKVYRMISGSYNPGDYTYYSDGSGLENGSLLLCTDAQFQTMDPALRERFVLTDLPAFPLYFDAAGISTNDPSPYRIYVCANGGIDLTALEY